MIDQNLKQKIKLAHNLIIKIKVDQRKWNFSTAKRRAPCAAASVLVENILTFFP